MADYKLTNREWAELVRKAQNGEEAGFEELYRASYNYLYAVCFKSGVPDEDIPDVLQESYIKIFKKIDTLEDPGTFLGWASTIVKNTGRDKGRQRKTYYERNDLMGDSSTEDEIGMDIMAVDEMDPDYNPGVALDKAATVKIVRDMIAELPDTQRDCIILWCEGRSMSDISQEVGIPVGSVKSSISYAKKKIRDMTLKIEKEQGIRLHTVAPMSFFIWAIRNIQDLLEFAPCDFSNILPVLKEAEIIAAKDASVLSDGTEANTAAKKAADKVGKDMGPEKGGTSATETGQAAAEQAGEIGGEKAAKRAATESGEKVIKNVTGASETNAAGILSTMGGKAAVAGLVVVIGASSLYFASRAGNQKPEEAAAAVTQEETGASVQEDAAEEKSENMQESESVSEASTVQLVEETQEEVNLLEQISELDWAVAEMVPAMVDYIDMKNWVGEIPAPEEFSVENTQLYWNFVHNYGMRYATMMSEDNHSTAVRISEIEEVSKTAFSDFVELPDTLEEHANGREDFGIYGDVIETPIGNPGSYYSMAEWNTTEDGKQIDVIFNEHYSDTDTQVAEYVVHIVPVDEAVRDDWRLKFFITGAEQVE